MVSGKLLLTDSTHILANAAKEKREIIEVPDTPSEYVKKLDREALETVFGTIVASSDWVLPSRIFACWGIPQTPDLLLRAGNAFM